MLRTILVPLNGSKRDSAALETAFLAALPFSAHLDCIHVRPTGAALIDQAVLSDYGGEGFAASAALSRITERSEEAARRARESFEAFCSGHMLERLSVPPPHERSSAEFRQIYGRWSDAVATEARCHDLTVLARSQDLSAGDAGEILLLSGTPVVLAAKEPQRYPLRAIAIAWKDRPEAARAVSAAMPLLERATRVVMLIGNEDDDTAMTCLDCTDAVVRLLSWHGVRAESRYVVPEGRSLPDAVLDSAAEVSADLIVAGAYGRSRLRELVFGGFTRRVLDGTTIPVLMAH